MSRKQRKTLLRICLSAVLLVAAKLLPQRAMMWLWLRQQGL